MKFKKTVLLVAITVLSLGCNSSKSSQNNEVNPNGKFVGLNGEILGPLIKSDDDWQKELDEFEYHVLRQAGTEQAFSGKYWENHKKGTYTCRACDLPLFDSETKFDSGTGWPSFSDEYIKGHVARTSDNSLGMMRTEVHCARCGGHLGHLFPDGPEPTGLRYCINSVSLDFVEND
jgi:peptide-methionine (R)-S-oxide reductase